MYFMLWNYTLNGGMNGHEWCILMKDMTELENGRHVQNVETFEYSILLALTKRLERKISISSLEMNEQNYENSRCDSYMTYS